MRKDSLTTFKRCARLEDANRRDPTEGKVNLTGKSDDGRIEMKVGTGDDAILLCTSLSANNIKVNGEVDDCCIVIHDVIGFASAITNALIREGHHVRMVLKGPCVYSDRKIERPMPSGKISDFIEETQGKDSFDFGKMFGFASEISKYDIIMVPLSRPRTEKTS